MYQHKNKVHPNTLSARYNLYKLIYYELFDSKAEALKRERQMKKWNRQWKINLIEKENPKWLDLIQENKV